MPSLDGTPKIHLHAFVDSDVFRQTKARAALVGESLLQVVEWAMQDWLVKTEPKEEGQE